MDITEEKANLLAPERFKEQIEQVEAKLRQKIQGYITELNNYEKSLPAIKTPKEAEKMLNNIISKANYYRNSDKESRYELIRQEINLILALLTITSNQKIDSVEACQAEKARLLNWRETVGEITSGVKIRYNEMITHLEQTQKQIETDQRNRALQWLIFNESEFSELQLTEATEKLDKAHKLLKKINQEQA